MKHEITKYLMETCPAGGGGGGGGGDKTLIFSTK